MTHRIGCLYVPLFPLAARLRSEPELTGDAIAIFQGNGSAARLVAATRRARQGGLCRGMTPSQARALLPKLKVRSRDPQCELAAQQGLLEIAESFSPRIENTTSGVVYMDLDGLTRHFPGDSPEELLAQSLTLSCAKAGLAVWVGIASSKLAARIAAENPTSPTIVPTRQAAAFIAPLPLYRLAPETEIFDTLQRWGLQTIGDFAALPKNEVAGRLGAAGQKLHEQARGLDPQPIIPYQPPATFDEGMDLDWPLVSLEPSCSLPALPSTAYAGAYSRAAWAAPAWFCRCDSNRAGFHERSILLPAPSCDVKTLLTLIRLDLEQQVPGAPVTGFTFTAHPDRPRAAQLTLFGPTALSPDKLATTLARLFALLGPEAVGSPRLENSHQPETFRLVDFCPPPPPETERQGVCGRGLLAIRVLRPPVRLEVECVADRQPKRIRSANDGGEIRDAVDSGVGKKPGIRGIVCVASGPWTIESGWWSKKPSERNYWDVELSDGGLYRIFFEHQSGCWFADGIYD